MSAIGDAQEKGKAAADSIRQRTGMPVRFAVVLGSGLGRPVGHMPHV